MGFTTTKRKWGKTILSWQAELLGINLDELEKERFGTYDNERAHHLHEVKAAVWTNQPVRKPRPSNWVSVNEAADLVYYHRSTILRWREYGKIRHCMQKNKIMVDKRDVLRHARRLYTATKVTTV